MMITQTELIQCIIAMNLQTSEQTDRLLPEVTELLLQQHSMC